MARHELPLDPAYLHGHFSRDLEPVLAVDPGDSVRISVPNSGWRRGRDEIVTPTRPDMEGLQSAQSGRSVHHSDRHGVIRGIQRGTAARNASYSFPNVSLSVGSSYATTWTWKASHNSAP